MVRLTKEQRIWVKKTFILISDQTDIFALHFFERLFEQAPELKSLFQGDLKVQGMKMIRTLAILISSTDHFDRITPQVEALGRLHSTYGVKPEYYPLVGDTLLWTLEQQLGKAFTPEAKAAWLHTYTLLVDIMTQSPHQNTLAISDLENDHLSDKTTQTN